MVVPSEKENSKMDNDKSSKSLLRNILLDNIYMCNQSIVRSQKLLEHVTERPDVGKHQEDILKMLSRMKTNLQDFESRCSSIEIPKKPQEKHFRFRKRSVLSLKRSNNDSTEETDVELVGSSMHNISPSKGCSIKKQNETNGLAQVEAIKKELPKSSNNKNIPDPVLMDMTNDEEESSSTATNVPNLNPVMIIASDSNEIKTDPASSNDSGGIHGNSQKQKRRASICVEHAGSITVPSDDESESEEDPIPFSRFDAQEPPDEALDLDLSQNNSVKIENESEVVKNKDQGTPGCSQGEKNDKESEKEDITPDDASGIKPVESRGEPDLLADFPSSSQEAQDLLELLTEKEKQDARDLLEVEKALKDIDDDDEDETGPEDSDEDPTDGDWLMTEDSSGNESDTSDDEGEVSEESGDKLDIADEESEMSSHESEDVDKECLPAVKECSVPLHRLDQMSDDEIDKLCTLHNVNKRKFCISPPERSAKRARKLSTTSESSDSSSDSFSYDFKEDPTDLNDLLPGSPIPTIEFLDDYVSTLDSSEAETDLDSETDMEKSQKKDNDKDITKSSEEKQGEDKQSEKCTDNIHEVETEVENEDTDEGAKKLESWRNDPLLHQRLWSDSDKESDSESTKRDTVLPKIEVDEETKARNYKPKLRSFVIEDDEDPLEDPTVISDSLSDTSNDSDIEFVDEQNVDPSPSQQPGRRNIRAVLTDEELTLETQRAKEEEDERIERLEKRSKTLSSIHSQRDELVLDYDIANGQPLVVVDQGLKDHLKAHQIEGVKFMWEACYESVKMLKTSSGGGCILAHCMGLGKTLQVITLIHTLFMHEKSTNTRHVLIVCPLSTVLNWKNEFRLADNKANKDVNLRIHSIGNWPKNQKCERVKTWRSEGGVLIMGYEAYEMLSNEKLAEKVSRNLFEDVQRALVNPGPDLVVCDEGHLIKNGKTLRNKALMKIETKRRIILTGTPLQNNLTEYYYMVEFVKPRLLGTLPEYKNRFGDPIMNGQFHNSTAFDIKIMKKRNHVLTKLLKKTIQRVESSVLKSYLPEIMDYTLFVNLTPTQISHYKKYIEMVRVEKIMSTAFFRDFQVTNYIGLHPYTLIRYNENSKKKKMKERETIEFDEDHQADNINVASEWWSDCTPADVSTKVELGSKLKVVWAILEEAVKLGDKVLIFSSSLVELDCLEHFLHMYGVQNSPWKRNTDFYRMDGTVPPQTRSYFCDQFNNPDNKEIKAFLISHKVGGLGLNLTAANRVILLEANHNPSYDLQCVYRIFRFGQTKKCFVYRLISNGTMEEKVYRKCVVKLAVASTVVDKYHVKRHYSSGDLETMYAYDFEQFESRPVPKVPKDKLLAVLLQSHSEIHTYHEHQALLENTPEEELNDEDKKLAWEEYNNEESKKNAPPAAPLVAPLVVVNAGNPNTAERSNIMSYFTIDLRNLLSKNSLDFNRLPPPPPYRPTDTRQKNAMLDKMISAPPQMYPINMHKTINSTGGDTRNMTPHYNNDYNDNNAIGLPQLNAPARVVSRPSGSSYCPPGFQATPAKQQLPVASGTTYRPSVIQGKHQLPAAVSTFHSSAVQATAAKHQLPVSAVGTYHSPTVQATATRHQLPAAQATAVTAARHQLPVTAVSTYHSPAAQPAVQATAATATRHKLPVSAVSTYHQPAVQASAARHQPTVARHQPAARHQPTVARHQPTAARHQTTVARHQPTAPRHQPTAARHQPTPSNQAAQISSRIQTYNTLKQEWHQRFQGRNSAPQTVSRNVPAAASGQVQHFRNPYAKPSSNGTTIVGNIQSIDLSNEPEPSNAQRHNVPSNQTNVQLNQPQGEFNYALNRFQ